MKTLRTLLRVGVTAGLAIASIGLWVLTVLLDGRVALMALPVTILTICLMLWRPDPEADTPPPIKPERPDVPGMNWNVAKEAVTPTSAGRANDVRFADEDRLLLQAEEQREQFERGWRGVQ
jgi:hypothetical protein